MNTIHETFEIMFVRESKLVKAIHDFFLKVASYPRLLLEVFIRRNMGHRYFSLATAITIAFLLLAFALFYNQLFPRVPGTFENVEEYEAWLKTRNDVFRFDFFTWYLFIIAFIYFAFRRQREINHNPDIYDFNTFSKYTGDKHPFFWTRRWFGKLSTHRTACTLYEPGAVFVAGVVLFLIGQKLGMLLMVSSLFYSFSYLASFATAHRLMWDKIDKAILNQEIGSFMIDGLEGPQTRNAEFFLDRPVNPDMRQPLVDILQAENSDAEKNALSF